jgi:hypothetical protein
MNKIKIKNKQTNKQNMLTKPPEMLSRKAMEGALSGTMLDRIRSGKAASLHTEGQPRTVCYRFLQQW